MTEQRKKDLIGFARKIGVEFKDLTRLNIALTHTSYANEKEPPPMHNERLEFLGDAVLELATSTYLYTNFPEMPEGELTKTRAGIVCAATLSKIATKLGFGEMLLLSRGEEQCGGRTRISNLEDAFEAVIGAVYEDRGWDAAREYVYTHLKNEFAAVKFGNYIHDYKSYLQEVVQRQPNRKIDYKLVGEHGPDHEKIFDVVVLIDGKDFGKGSGHSKKEAEQHAAKVALSAMQEKGLE